MLYSKKTKLDRRNAIMAAVKKELKANNAYVVPEALQKLEEALNTSTYYYVEIIRDAEEAAKRLKLVNRTTEHKFSGDEGCEESGSVVYGNVSFGEDYYFYDCELDKVTERVLSGDFDMDQAFIVTIDCHDWDYDHCDFNGWTYTIVLYSPETIIDEKEYEATKNAELDQICQLRESKYKLPKAE